MLSPIFAKTFTNSPILTSIGTVMTEISFQNLDNGSGDKNKRGWVTLKKSPILAIYIEKFFSILKPKVAYLCPFLSSLSFLKF